MILFKLKMSKIHVGKIRLGEKDWKVGVLKDCFERNHLYDERRYS